MATIDIVTDSGGAQPNESESATTQPAEPVPAPAPVAEPTHRHDTAQQRSMTLVVTVFGTIITALIGGMFLFIVSALDGLRDDIATLRSDMNSEISSLRSEFRSELNTEIGSLRSEMNARFAEVDRRFDEINGVLLDHTDRLARIETTLDISGRPVGSEARTPTEP